MTHEWFDCGMLNGVLSCRKCGVVRQRDGSNENKPCRGHVRVGPRVTETCPVCGDVNDADKEHSCGLPTFEDREPLTAARLAVVGKLRQIIGQ